MKKQQLVKKKLKCIGLGLNRQLHDICLIPIFVKLDIQNKTLERFELLHKCLNTLPIS